MISGISSYFNDLSVRNVSTQELTPAKEKTLKQVGHVQCATCANRKYQDGSDEMVSFKAPAHISPEGSAAAVMSHEREHVANAYGKASKNNGKVLQASVSIHTSICPECGRSYVSGGTTSTMISYQEDNPYGKNAKSRDYEALSGSSINIQA